MQWHPLSSSGGSASAASAPGSPSAGAFASVAIGGGSPAFKHERAFDIAGFKLAGLLQQILSAHIALKIVALALVGAPVIYAWGCLYAAITGAPVSLGVFKVYTVVLRAPGARVTEETSLPAAMLINAAFLTGVFTFAVVIGIVSEEIKSKLSAVRRGNIPLATTDHLLVCNWNRQAPLLLRQMATNGHGDSKRLGRSLVVLADRDKDQLDADVARQLNGSGLHYVTRRGAPHCAKDLETVAAAHAKTVILLHPDHDPAAEVHKTATLLGLQSSRNRPSTTLRRQRVVLQNPEVPASMRASAADQANHTLAGVVQRSLPASANIKLVEVNGHRNMARLIAQSAVQPGVSTILGQIAQSAPGAPDFHLMDVAAVAGSGQEQGLTFQEARRKLRNAVVCGYISSADRGTHLNPPDLQQLSRYDKLIVLSHSSTPQLVPGDGTAAGLDVGALQRRLQAAQPPAPAPKSIVVVGWSGPLGDLMAGLTDFAAPGSEVFIVNSERPPDFPEEVDDVWQVEGRAVRHIPGDILDREAYERAGVASAHAIILGSLQAEDLKDADARMLTSLLMVQDIVNAAQAAPGSGNGIMRRPPHVVACVQFPETVQTASHILTELARTRVTAELLQPGELVSGMLLQVAHEPALAAALSELIDSCKGAELYLRRPERYGLGSSTAHSWAEVSELARLREETALGYIGPDGRLVLVPDSTAAMHYGRDARIVVLSEC